MYWVTLETAMDLAGNETNSIGFSAARLQIGCFVSFWLVN